MVSTNTADLCILFLTLLNLLGLRSIRLSIPSMYHLDILACVMLLYRSTSKTHAFALPLTAFNARVLLLPLYTSPCILGKYHVANHPSLWDST